MQQVLRSKKYKITINQDFENVIELCKKIKRKGQADTWITKDMKNAYMQLHQMGLAHSVEVWNKDKQLVGGLYGINLGTVFYGESMFHTESNTSKLAFITLAQAFPFSLIDCQVYTKHLESLGASMISGKEFYKKIVNETKKPNILNDFTNFVQNEK